MKKILVLEDNSIMLAYLSTIIRDIDTNNEVYNFDNIKDAYQCALEKTINLFVIDIMLDSSIPNDVSGLRFIENIRQISRYSFVPVIFVTSLEDARMYTYEKLHCYSFIEKPFDVERLKILVKQCLDFPENRGVSKTLYFRKDGIILAVEREDIVYAESMNHVMYIHTKQGDILKIPYITLKKLKEELDSIDMIQCSRSAIINKKYIHNVDLTNQIIQLKNNFGRVEIGVMFKKRIKDIFL